MMSVRPRRMSVPFLCLAGWILLPSDGVAQRPTRADSTRDSTLVLAPIAVTVTRQATDLSRVPFSVAAVSGDVLRDGRATLGLDEALGEVPGLLVSNRYNFSLDQRVSIRGFGARAAFGARGVKIVLDGIPQTLPDGQGQLTNIDLATIGSVEVLRGAASSLYGNASGGVISLRSEEPSTVDTEVSLRSVAGSYGMSKLQTGVSTPMGRGSIAFRASRTVSDGYREHADAVLNNVSVQLRQDVAARTRLLISGHYANDPTLDNPGSLDSAQVANDPSQANVRNAAADAGKALKQGQIGVTVSHDLVGGTTLEFMGFGLFRDLDNPLSFAYIGLDRVAAGGRASASGMLGDDVHYTVGVDLQHQRDDRIQETTDRTVVTRDQLERVTEFGPFVQLSWDLHERVTYTGGVRFDRMSFSADDRLLADGDASGTRTMSSPSFSSGVTVRVVPGFQPFVNVGTSFETPTTTELNNRPTGGGGFNPDLDPQNATSFELGVRGSVAGRASYAVTGFYVDVRDALIPFEVVSEPGRQYFRNAGKTRHQGIEVSAAIYPIEQVRFVTAYTFADYTFTEFTTVDGVFDGNRIPGVPKHRLYGSVRADVARGLWVAADYNVASRQFVDDVNSRANSGWFTADFRTGWTGRVNGWRISPFAGLLNAFDEQYVGSLSVNAGFNRFFEPAPPRNGYVGVEIRR